MVAMAYPPSEERADVIKEFIEFIGYQADWYKAIICPGPTYRVIGEIQQFVPPSNVITLYGYISLAGGITDWTLPDTYITPSSVVVQDSSGLHNYVLNSDYTVDYDNGRILRLTTGTIPSSGEVMIGYTWKEPDIDPKTGNPRIDCPICEGDGRIFADPEPVMGLYHIPRFDSPLTEVGYWRMGDAYFTVSAYSDIGIRTKNEMHLLIRDKLIINSREYRVMSEGSTFSMQAEIIGCKLHLRLLEKG